MVHWNPGDVVALRGMIGDRVWFATSHLVVKDDDQETVLLLEPGAEGACTDFVVRRANGQRSPGERWRTARSGVWTLREFHWTSNRFLILLRPARFYSIYLIWDKATDVFLGYYFNFQVPYRRSHCGFDTLDLDLDLIVYPDDHWEWKDEDEYQAGIGEGGIREEWVKEIERAQSEIFEMVAKHSYPLDGSWLSWRPDPSWQPPRLPAGWDSTDGPEA